MSVHADSISISLVTSTNHVDVRVPSNLLDNRWHTIEFIYKLGSLKFFVDRRETIIANSTYNTLFLTDAPNDDSAILIIGASYSGCILQGPGINFSSVAVKDIDSVLFGPCPLIQGPCKQNDIMIRAQIDQCLHDPCMSRGVCTSKADTYEVCYCALAHAFYFFLKTFSISITNHIKTILNLLMRNTTILISTFIFL